MTNFQLLTLSTNLLNLEFSLQWGRGWLGLVMTSFQLLIFDVESKSAKMSNSLCGCGGGGGCCDTEALLKIW